MSSPTPWRGGTKVHRTLYDGENKLIGMMDTAEDAAAVCAAMNGRATGVPQGIHDALVTDFDAARDRWIKDRDTLTALVFQCLAALRSVRNTDDHADPEVRAEVRAAIAAVEEVVR